MKKHNEKFCNYRIIGCEFRNLSIFTKKHSYTGFIVCDNDTFMSWYSIGINEFKTWEKEKPHKTAMRKKMLFV